MKPLTQLLAFTIFAVASAFSFAGDISEAHVSKLLAQVDAAIQKKSPSGIAATLSDELMVKINIHAGGRQRTIRVGKHEYISMLRQGWDMATSYSYSRRNEKIAISGNAATVSADITETMTIQGQRMRTTTREVATIEMVNGVPLITKISADSTM